MFALISVVFFAILLISLGWVYPPLCIAIVIAVWGMLLLDSFGMI